MQKRGGGVRRAGVQRPPLFLGLWGEPDPTVSKEPCCPEHLGGPGQAWSWLPPCRLCPLPGPCESPPSFFSLLFRVASWAFSRAAGLGCTKHVQRWLSGSRVGRRLPCGLRPVPRDLQTPRQLKLLPGVILGTLWTQLLPIRAGSDSISEWVQPARFSKGSQAGWQLRSGFLGVSVSTWE